MHVFAETERLFLRAILPEDEEAFFELDSDPDVHRYLGNRPIGTKEEAKELMQRVWQQYRENGIGRWAMVEKSTLCFVGWTGLKLEKNPINGHTHFYDLGYRLLKRHWGKGYATEGGIASLNYGFGVLHLDTIYARAHVENAASNGVLKKLGFRFINTFYLGGIHHNWYELHRKEWPRPGAPPK